MREASAPFTRHDATSDENPERPIQRERTPNGSAVTIAESLRITRERLRSTGIDAKDAAFEARVLHQEALGLSTAEIFTRLLMPLAAEIRVALDRMIERRCAREPLAYILGHRGFFGLDLRVDRRALIPRPETELLVEAAVSLAARSTLVQPLIVDVGTGSGAIAIALAGQIPRARLIAIDRSTDALALAAENVRRHRLEDRVELLAGDVLAPVRSTVDLIVANLPYVPDSDLLDLAPEVRDFEPRLALAGGPDGLDLYRRLVEQARFRLRRPGALVIEIGVGQSAAARDLVIAAFPDAKVNIIPDYAGIPRIVTAVAT